MPLAATQLNVADGADALSAPASGSAVSRREPVITIRGLSKSFNDTVIYDKFDLDLPQGQFISIFGPNGCGKSTLINMISGLLPLDAGQVLFDGQTIQETRLSYVFQNYRDALFPWLRAIDNIHYPLKLMGLSRRERDQRVEQLLADFGVKIDLNS
jgi:NitT/TauT family transport system ATP-binding protein